MQACETAKGHQDRLENGFYEKYMSGVGLDIGWRGYNGADETVLPSAVGIDLDFPGYDGIHLPFPDNSQDYVFASHVLEHIPGSYVFAALRDWWRVIKPGGHLVLAVPHRDLFEKRLHMPSAHCEDHKRFYTPVVITLEIEAALQINSYRLVHMREVDTGFDYENLTKPPHPFRERYEIELVLRKRTDSSPAGDL